MDTSKVPDVISKLEYSTLGKKKSVLWKVAGSLYRSALWQRRLPDGAG